MSEDLWFDQYAEWEEWQEHRRAHGLRGLRCNAVGCYRKVSRWTRWRHRRDPFRAGFCGGCNRRREKAAA